MLRFSALLIAAIWTQLAFAQPSAGVYDTKERYFGEKGAYSTSRLRVHDAIIDEVLQKGPSSERPVILFTAGQSGSGKSTVVKSLVQQGVLPESEFIVIDSDLLQRKLPEFAEFRRLAPDLADQMVYREARDLTTRLVRRALQLNKKIVLEGTMANSRPYLELMEHMSKHHPNYAKFVLHVSADPALQKARVEARAKRTGRVLPPSVMARTGDPYQKSINELLPHLDGVFDVVNNERPVMSGVRLKGTVFGIDLPLAEGMRSVLESHGDLSSYFGLKTKRPCVGPLLGGLKTAVSRTGSGY